MIWRKTYVGGNLYSRTANNGGHDNRYWYPVSEGSGHRFLWKTKKLNAFRRTRGEERGRYLSDAEKDRVLAAKNIPADPEH